MSQMLRQPEAELMDSADEAEAYAAADFSTVNQAFVDRLVELAKGMETARAVDLGTGPADIPIRLAKARPGWRITAVDASEAMLTLGRRAVAEAGLARRICLVVADAKHLALPDDAFDVVLSNSILHHLNGPAAFWSEVKRIAAPGAVVLLRDLSRPPTAEDAYAIVQRYAGDESRLLQQEFYRSLLASYTVEEVRGQLAAAGLDNLQAAMVTDRHMDIWGRLSKGD